MSSTLPYTYAADVQGKTHHLHVMQYVTLTPPHTQTHTHYVVSFGKRMIWSMQICTHTVERSMCVWGASYYIQLMLCMHWSN